LYPWLRLLRLRASIGSRSDIQPATSTRIRMRVWPNDLDMFLHVNNGRYLTLADLGRLDWVLRTGVFAASRAHEAIPVVADAMAKFRRSLELFQRFEIHTRVLGWDEKWSFVEHRFVRADRVVGVVVARVCFRTAAGVLDPNVVLKTAGYTAESPALPDWLDGFQRGADSLSEVLREEEYARGVR